MNLYVSNLSFHTSETDLESLFSKIGKVTSVKIIMDRETNRSRGFAFVEMASEDEGKKAIEELNGKEIEGRQLSVAVAREKENRSGGGGGGNYSRSNNRRFS
ncbi:MAG: RNA-binding protein [Parafilimonas sp.]|jgi:cold-inducible RNA-binding protein